jgi:hypothetical protein
MRNGADIPQAEIDVAVDALKALDQEAEAVGRPISYFYMARTVLAAVAKVRGKVVVRGEDYTLQ